MYKQVYCLISKNKVCLSALLKEVEGKKRGLVACKSEEEVNYISRVLVDMGMNKILVAHKNMTSVDITGA